MDTENVVAAIIAAIILLGVGTIGYQLGFEAGNQSGQRLILTNGTPTIAQVTNVNWQPKN